MDSRQKRQLNRIGYACEIRSLGVKKKSVEVSTSGAGTEQAESMYYSH